MMRTVDVAAFFGDSLAPDGNRRVENFRAWFGDSKVVGPDGHPVVACHGTAYDVPALRMSTRGSFGAGFYFAPDSMTAEAFIREEVGQSNVMPVFLALSNPAFANADFEVGEEIEFDSAAVPLVRYAFGNGAHQVLADSMAGDGKFGLDLQDALKRMGHDGIIARYNDGSLEYVAFKHSQLKAVHGNSGLFVADSQSLLDDQASLRARAALRALAERSPRGRKALFP